MSALDTGRTHSISRQTGKKPLLILAGCPGGSRLFPAVPAQESRTADREPSVILPGAGWPSWLQCPPGRRSVGRRSANARRKDGRSDRRPVRGPTFGRPGAQHGRQASEAAGSFQARQPLAPPCPKEPGEASEGAMCGSLSPRSSTPSPQGQRSHRPTPITLPPRPPVWSLVASASRSGGRKPRGVPANARTSASAAPCRRNEPGPW